MEYIMYTIYNNIMFYITNNLQYIIFCIIYIVDMKFMSYT